MFNLHTGKDYQLYQFYIWGGLAAIVVYIIVIAVSGISEDFRTMMIILNIPITIWFFGILAYWWWVFLYKGRDGTKDPYDIDKKKGGLLSPLKSWSTLFDSMMESGGNREEIDAYERASRRPVIAWYGLQNFLALWVVGNFWVWTLFQEHLPKNYIITIWTPGVLVIAFLLLLSPVFLFRLFGSGPFDYLKPIGLFVSETPPAPSYSAHFSKIENNAFPDDATLIGGSRNGRNIFIGARGKHSVTWVEGKAPSFLIRSDSGRLEAAENSPETVKKFVKGFPKAKRWKEIVITGDSKGIRTERNSRGLNMWLYDLWLTEQLFKILT